MVFDLGDLLSGRSTPDATLVPSDSIPGLYLLPAPADASTPIDAGRLQTVVDDLRWSFDWMILDTPAGMGDFVRAAADVCDRALVVLTPDEIAVRDAGLVAQLFRQRGCTTLHILINKVYHKHRHLNAVTDFDWIIDTTTMPLLGILPFDRAVPLSQQIQPVDSMLKPIFHTSCKRIAARLVGEHPPLAIL